MTNREKAFWITFMTLLMFAEIRSLYVADKALRDSEHPCVEVKKP
jgi:hypothetical protein